MVDRVSSYQVNVGSINNLLRSQASVAATEEKIATGKRVTTPADDPVAAARILQLEQEIELTDQYIRNINSLTGRLELQDSTLGGVEDILQRVRELTVSAGNGASTQSDRQSSAEEMAVRVDELVNLFNTQDASGEYLFSGFSGQTRPFEPTPGGGYSYQGDEGQRQVRISNTARVAASDNGKDLFVDVPVDNPSFNTSASTRNNGSPPGIISQGVTTDAKKLAEFSPNDAVITFNNDLDADPPAKNFTVRRRGDNSVIEGLRNVSYTPGQSIEFAGIEVRITGQPVAGDDFVVETTGKQGPLQTIGKLVEGLQTLGDSPGDTRAVNALIEESLDNLDAGIENLSMYRARVGARLKTAETTLNVHEDTKLVSQDVRSGLADLDYAKAVSELQMETMVLEAAQQSYAKVASLSLFNFLR